MFNTGATHHLPGYYKQPRGCTMAHIYTLLINDIESYLAAQFSDVQR